MSLDLPDPLVVRGSDDLEAWGVQRNFETIAQAFTDLRGLLFIGTGSPNGVITASPPALYLNLSGGAGTTLWIKETGSNTNVGWVGK